MATASQRAQNFLAKNQTNEALPLAKCPTMKETVTLPRDQHEIYADNTVTYAGYEEECVRYHGLSREKFVKHIFIYSYTKYRM